MTNNMYGHETTGELWNRDMLRHVIEIRFRFLLHFPLLKRLFLLNYQGAKLKYINKKCF